MVTDTSIEAYHQKAAELSTQRDRIYEVVRQATRPSSNDIQRLTGIPRTSVCGRLRELEKEGMIRKKGKKIDPWSKARVYWYAVTEGSQ